MARLTITALEQIELREYHREHHRGPLLDLPQSSDDGRGVVGWVVICALLAGFTFLAVRNVTIDPTPLAPIAPVENDYLSRGTP